MRRILAAALASFGCLSAFGVEREVRKAPASTPSVKRTAASCEVRSDRAEIRTGSPLLVRLVLTNRGQTPLTLGRPFDDATGGAALFLRPAGQSEWTRVRGLLTGLRDIFGYRASLAPGESMAAFFLVLAGPDGGLSLREPGTYQFEGRATGPKVKCESPLLLVTVRPGDPDAVGRLDRSGNDLRHFSLEEPLSKERLERLRALLAGLPEFEEALAFAEAFAILGHPEWGRGEEAIALLRKLRSSGEPLWSELATAHLSLALAKAGDLEAARRLLGEIQNRSTAGDEAAQLIKRKTRRPLKEGL